MVMFRVGLVAVLRSKSLSGQVVGIMMTASHNPEQDNGVKIVEPMGEMLISAWEGYSTQVANASNEDLPSVLKQVIKDAHVDMSQLARIVYGHDTRPSTVPLLKALEDGLNCFSSIELIKAGLVTTPQLHYLVRTRNDSSYGTSTEQGYYEKLTEAYKPLVASSSKLPGKLVVDCSNGVGAPKLKALLKELNKNGIHLECEIVNDKIDTQGLLNKDCGADYVKTQQRAPPSIPVKAQNEFDRYCSFDGDADRIVFYYASSSSQFRLLDGDKIATLAAMHLIDLVKAAGLQEELHVGVVQTAYANGNSTTYLTKTKGVPVTCTPTGVKYLHHAAQQYDVGVYFEANGHGTVLFSLQCYSILSSTKPSSPAQQDALERLRAYTDLINQTVGDALSDLLLVESILLQRQMTPAAWDANYMDLPNKLVKVIVPDRNAFKTTDAERKLVEPKHLQAKIDSLVAKYGGGRSFVRPSGTEDCVRVYAEAQRRAEADGDLLY